MQDDKPLRPVLGEKLGLELLRALGLPERGVTSISLDCTAGKFAAVRVETLIAADSDFARKFEWFDLVPRDAPRQTDAPPRSTGDPSSAP